MADEHSPSGSRSLPTYLVISMNIVLLAESLNYKETGKDYDEVSSLNEVSCTHVNLDTSVMLGIRAQHSRECHSPHLLSL